MAQQLTATNVLWCAPNLRGTSIMAGTTGPLPVELADRTACLWQLLTMQHEVAGLN